jgi:hypothetical protein
LNIATVCARLAAWCLRLSAAAADSSAPLRTWSDQAFIHALERIDKNWKAYLATELVALR